jgi:hypothetical protein
MMLTIFAKARAVVAWLGAFDCHDGHDDTAANAHDAASIQLTATEVNDVLSRQW